MLSREKRSVTDADALARRTEELFAPAKKGAPSPRFFASLARLFASLDAREGAAAFFPELAPLMEGCVKAVECADRQGAEDVLTMLYAYVHGDGMSYSPAERARLDESGGYWCHAGGLSPLWRAEEFIAPSSRLADFGAGNGFQGLLFQYLYPHRETTLIELSGPMVERGKKLQTLMGIEEERVSWIHGSVTEVSPGGFDFIYIYRPLRPERREGKLFYEHFAAELMKVRGPMTIFSIADCLKDELDDRFRLFHDDGQLACFHLEA